MSDFTVDEPETPSPQEQGENRAKAQQGVPPAEYRFKPGQSGNPGGRPKGRAMSTVLAKWLDEVDPKTGLLNIDLVIKGMGLAAMKGNPSVIKEMFDRTEGKVPEKLIADLNTQASSGVKIVEVHHPTKDAPPDADP